MFSRLQNLSAKRRDPDKWNEQYQEVVSLVTFCMLVASYQIRRGRKFSFEHPTGASSWQLEQVVNVAAM